MPTCSNWWAPSSGAPQRRSRWDGRTLTAIKVVEQFHNEHAERYLLAFVYGYLGDHDLMAVRTEAEKYLMMGALNLVECVAFVGAVKPTQ
ncbi:MAG TPA: hypothetical protein PK420_13280 [Rubrivivax sp.]|nr:hypothetical protein [Rubrivivax sp.]